MTRFAKHFVNLVVVILLVLTLVNSAIQRPACIPREEAHRKTKINEKTKRPIFKCLPDSAL